MPDQLGDTQGAAGVARGWLDPDSLERTFAQQPPVAYAVERDAAGQAEVVEPREATRRLCHPEHHLFAHDLNRAGQIHFPLREFGFGLSWWSAEYVVEGGAGHRQAREI